MICKQLVVIVYEKSTPNIPKVNTLIYRNKKINSSLTISGHPILYSNANKRRMSVYKARNVSKLIQSLYPHPRNHNYKPFYEFY